MIIIIIIISLDEVDIESKEQKTRVKIQRPLTLPTSSAGGILYLLYLLRIHSQ